MPKLILSPTPPDATVPHKLTSCKRAAATICLCPCKFTITSYLFARWHLFRHVGYLRHQQQVDLWPFDLETGVRVTCDVGYLCANFSLHRPLCSRVTLDVRDRQTSDRRQTKSSLNASALWGRMHNKRQINVTTSTSRKLRINTNGRVQWKQTSRLKPKM